MAYFQFDCMYMFIFYAISIPYAFTFYYCTGLFDYRISNSTYDTASKCMQGSMYSEEEGYLVPTIARKRTCRCFDWAWMLQSSSGWKWRRCKQTLLFIATHYTTENTSLEVKGRWGLLLPPCLLITAVQQPGTSSPPSRQVIFRAIVRTR